MRTGIIGNFKSKTGKDNVSRAAFRKSMDKLKERMKTDTGILEIMKRMADK